MHCEDQKYAIGPELDKQINTVAKNLNITKSEAVRRALNLFIHAAPADSINIKKGTENINIKIK